MIRDREAYQRLRVDAEQRSLRDLDDDAAIALAEALLTSSVLTTRARRDAPRPLSLARSLGIDPNRIVRPARPTAP